MKKELIYKNEKRKLSIVFAIFVFNLLFCILIVSYFINEDMQNNQVFLLLFGIFGLFITNLLYILNYKLPLYKVLKQNKDIKENGIKTTGYIEEFIYRLSYQNIRSNNDPTIIKEENVKLKVSYVNPGTNNKEVFITPLIAFSPIDDLGSRNCDVYILDDKVLACNFVAKNSNELSIWSEDDISVIRMQDEIRRFKEEKKSFLIYGIALIVILLVMSLLVFFIKK